MSMREQGTGSIRWRDDRQRWEARLTVGYLPSGNPRRITKLFSTKNEALRWIAAQQAARDSGTLVVPSRQLLRDWVTTWLASKRVAQKTLADYRYVFDRLVLPGLGNTALSDLTPLAVQNWLNQLLTTRSHKEAHRAVHHLRMALKAAVDLEVLSRNPAVKVAFSKPTASTFARWSADEAKAAIAYAIKAKHPLRYYLQIALATGMRRSELLGLRWQDVGDDYLDVQQALAYIKGSPVFGPPKTGPRRVYIDGGTRTAIESQRDLVVKAKLRRRLWHDSDLVFPSSNGGPANERQLYRQWAELCTGAQVPRIRISDTRSTWVSLTEGLGPELWLARRAGHSVEIRRKHYSRTLEEEARSIAFGINALLFEPRAGGRAGGRAAGNAGKTVGDEGLADESE